MDITEAQKTLKDTLNGLKSQCDTKTKLMINDIQNAMKKGDLNKLNELKAKLEANVASNK